MIFASVINIICFGIALLAGYQAWALWSIFVIAVVSGGSYIMLRPGFKESIQREREMGATALLFIGVYIASLLPVAIFYGIGWIFS